jgi:hypothetical protein
MELGKGVKIAIGAKTFKDEIPDALLEGNDKLKDIVVKANARSKENAKNAEAQKKKDDALEKKRADKKKKAAAARAKLLNPEIQKVEDEAATAPKEVKAKP